MRPHLGWLVAFFVVFKFGGEDAPLWFAVGVIAEQLLGNPRPVR